jgi:hypothetical protein
MKFAFSTITREHDVNPCNGIAKIKESSDVKING